MGLPYHAPLLTVREVAQLLGVRPVTVYRLCERGELPHVGVSNALRFHPDDLDEFLRSTR